MNKKKNVFLLCCVYRLVLEGIYKFIVCIEYGYRGYSWEFNVIKYLLSYFIFCILFYFLPLGKKKVSFLVLQLHFVIMIIPLLSIYSIADQDTSFFVAVCFCFLLEEIIITSSSNKIKLPVIKINLQFFIGFLWLLSLYVCFEMFIANGLHLEVINLVNIYEARKSIIYPFSLMRYLVVWQYRFIAPYLLIYYFQRKQYRFIPLIIIVQLILYLILPRKEILFSICLISVLLIILPHTNFIKLLLGGLTVGSFLLGIIYFTLNFKLPVAILPIRLLIDPAMIKFRHFEAFSNELPKLHYSEGAIGKLLNIPYIYDQPSGNIVSQLHGDIISNENAGYIAYAYDNAGYIGMIIMTIIFITLMLVIDSLVRDKDIYTVFALIIYPMYVLNDGDLLTSLLTGGLIFAIFLLWLDRNTFCIKDKRVERLKLKQGG